MKVRLRLQPAPSPDWRIGEAFRQDLRYGLRMFVRSPGFTAIAVLALAVGIGANSAIFSVVNAVLLRSLPYEEPERVVMLWERRVREGSEKNVVAPGDYLDWRAQTSVFRRMAAHVTLTLNLTGEDEPERVGTGVISAGFFDVLGVPMRLGRAFFEEEEQPGKDHVVILGHGIWQRRFGSDSAILGRKIFLNGERYSVVGVLPASFRFPDKEIEIWTPLGFTSQEIAARGQHFLQVYARLQPGVSIERAQAEMDVIAARLEAQFPDVNRGHGVKVVSLREQLVGDIRKALLVLLAAVGFVLLIACANVANLLLARAAGRRKEIAIRAAMGAGRGRVMAQLLAESLLLGLVAGGAGVVLAVWGVRLLKLVLPGNVNVVGLDDIGIDAPVLLFTLGLSLATGFVFGLVPAMQLSATNLTESLKEGGRSTGVFLRQRSRALLVISEIALALILLVGAGLMIRSFVFLNEVSPGFEPRNVLTMQLVLPLAKYREGRQMSGFFEQLAARLAAIPGVRSAGAISHLPLSGNDSRRGITIEGRPPNPQEPTRAHFRIVTPGYFQAMGIPLRDGRHVSERDAASSPLVLLINERAAQRYWPGESAVGKRLRLSNTSEWREIVGVVGDVRHSGLDIVINPEMYLPAAQLPVSSMTVVMRVASDPLGFTGAVRAQVLSLDGDQPVANLLTMEDLLARSVSSRRFYMLLLGVFAAVALVLASAGIYGVMSYTVTQRTHEIGLRMALGANQSEVLRLVVGQALGLTLSGVLAGALGALSVTRFISSFLFEVKAYDITTFLVVTAILVAVALSASYLPARRAARVDPLHALRHE